MISGYWLALLPCRFQSHKVNKIEAPSIMRQSLYHIYCRTDKAACASFCTKGVFNVEIVWVIVSPTEVVSNNL